MSVTRDYLDEIQPAEAAAAWGASSMLGMDVEPDMGTRPRWSPRFRLGLGADEDEGERSRVARFEGGEEGSFLKRFWPSSLWGKWISVIVYCAICYN